MNLIPPINHLLFIPFILGAGFLLGWNLGTRNIRNEWARAEERRRKAEEEG